MKKIIFFILLICSTSSASAQSSKIELFDLIKKLLNDSTGYENVGDWAVGQPKKFPVKWNEDQLNMSEDTSINFYRMGTADIILKGRSFMQSGKPVKWNIMLKGPRMGYTSFSIIRSPSTELQPKYTIDSIFGKKPFTAKLLKSCDGKTLSGYYYYEVKLPKKDIAFIKLSWVSVNGNTAIRIDCFDNWSKYAVKLDCK
ncbi:MAG: hypothetical protein ACKVOM_07140 [Ferruginibacter sp.]